MAEPGERERVLALIQAGRPTDAVALARTALATDPHDGNMTVLLAMALGESGELSAAIEASERAIGLRPDDALAHRTLGWNIYRAGRYEDGAAALRRALELDPHNANTHVMLGDVLVRQTPEEDSVVWGSVRHAELVHAIDGHGAEAVRLQPAQAGGYLIRAKACLAWKNAAGATEWARRALAIEPNNPVGHQLLGLAAKETGDVEAAAEHFVTAGKLNPHSRTAVVHLRRLKSAPLVGWVGTVLLTWFALSAGGGIGGPVVAIVLVVLLWAGLWYYPRWKARRSMSAEARQVLERERQFRRG